MDSASELSAQICAAPNREESEEEAEGTGEETDWAGEAEEGPTGPWKGEKTPPRPRAPFP